MTFRCFSGKKRPYFGNVNQITYDIWTERKLVGFTASLILPNWLTILATSKPRDPIYFDLVMQQHRRKSYRWDWLYLYPNTQGRNDKKWPKHDIETDSYVSNILNISKYITGVGFDDLLHFIISWISNTKKCWVSTKNPDVCTSSAQIPLNHAWEI